MVCGRVASGCFFNYVTGISAIWMHAEAYCSPYDEKGGEINMYWFYSCLSSKVDHYSDVIMSAMASQITAVSNVCSTVCSGVDQRKHQSSVSLVIVRGMHRWPVDSLYKDQWLGKCFRLMTSLWTATSFATKVAGNSPSDWHVNVKCNCSNNVLITTVKFLI